MSVKAKFEDSFTEAIDTDLDDHSPDFGDSWSIGIDNDGVLKVEADSDSLQPASIEISKGIAYIIDRAISNDQWVECYGIESGIPGKGQYILLRYVDSTHWYAFRFISNRLRIYKQNGGSIPVIFNVSPYTLNNHSWLGFDIIGTTLSIYVDYILEGTVVDIDHSSGKSGIGMGFVAVGSDDLDPADQELDWFRTGNGGYLASFEFLDTFTEAGDTDLDLHTPDVGTSWTELIQVSAAVLEVEAATDRLHPKANQSNDGVAYTADESSRDHRVGMRLESRSARWYLFARIQDSNNFYALEIRSTVGVLYKKISGVWNALGSSFSISQNDFLELEVEGSIIRARINGTIVQQVIDTSITTTGVPGIGTGSLRTSGLSVTTSDYINSFRVVILPPNLRGSIVAQSSITGSLSVHAAYEGLINAQSSITGSLSVHAAYEGTITAQSSITGSLSVHAAYSGSIDAQSAITGSLSVHAKLEGAIRTFSRYQGALSADVPIEGLIPAQSSMTAVLRVNADLIGTIAAVSVMTGKLTEIIFRGWGGRVVIAAGQGAKGSATWKKL